MKINRRQFVIGTTGATAAVVASTSAIAAVNTKVATPQDIIVNTIVRKFPQVSAKNTGVQNFAKALLSRNPNMPGTTGITLQAALDDKTYHVNFERYVVREFVYNTNFLLRKEPNFNGLVYKADFVKNSKVA